jgi:hypothetical protein
MRGGPMARRKVEETAVMKAATMAQPMAPRKVEEMEAQKAKTKA